MLLIGYVERTWFQVSFWISSILIRIQRLAWATHVSNGTVSIEPMIARIKAWYRRGWHSSSFLTILYSFIAISFIAIPSKSSHGEESRWFYRWCPWCYWRYRRTGSKEEEARLRSGCRESSTHLWVYSFSFSYNCCKTLSPILDANVDMSVVSLLSFFPTLLPNCCSDNL